MVALIWKANFLNFLTCTVFFVSAIRAMFVFITSQRISRTFDAIAALKPLVQRVVVTILLIAAVSTVLAAVTPFISWVHCASVGTAVTVAVCTVSLVTPIQTIFPAVAPITF